MKLEFGYLPTKLDVGGADWSISTLPDLDAQVAWVEDHPNIREGWIYPGNRQRQEWPSGKTSEDPFNIRVFGLPKTHVLSLDASDDIEHLKFVIWVLSFFYGIRLTSETNGFLDAATSSPGMLVDFIIGTSAESAVALAKAFWTTSVDDPAQAKRFAAAVHVLFMAQGKQLLQFERFIYSYTALDACFALLKNGKSRTGGDSNHAKRTQWMCEKTGVPVPDWASVGPNGSTQISALRNDAMHEALFAGAPFGFELIEDSVKRNLPLEMKHLTCRLLASIIGVADKNYVGMRTDIYARHWLHL